MCLLTESKKALIAQSDIVCYKLLIYDKKMGKAMTPYQHIEIPQLPYLMDDIQMEEQIQFRNDVGDYVFMGGFIHSVINIRKYMAYQSIERNTFYVKSIIPKGTPYYIGRYGDVCSKKLQLSEVIPIEKVIEMFSNIQDWYIPFSIEAYIGVAIEEHYCPTAILEQIFPKEVELEKEKETECI